MSCRIEHQSGWLVVGVVELPDNISGTVGWELALAIQALEPLSGEERNVLMTFARSRHLEKDMIATLRGLPVYVYDKDGPSQ